MRVLIIEDNEFNAFCLRRLLESVITLGTVTLVNNSNAALALFYSHPFDLVIIDGDLGAARSQGAYCNGPELAQILLHKYPQTTLVVWTDSQQLRQEFSAIFNQYDRQLDYFSLWNKTVSMEFIYKTFSHFFPDLMGHPIPRYKYFSSSLGY